MSTQPSSSSPKRLNKSCLRCMQGPGWSDTEFNGNKNQFLDCGLETRSKQVQYQAKRKPSLKTQMTMAQKKILINLIFSQKSECLLCCQCFSEFSGFSAKFLWQLKKKVQSVKWTDLHLLKHHLQNGHIGKESAHKLPQHVLNKIQDFCNDSYFFWDPCHEKICFNSDMNSWKQLHAEFISIHGPKVVSCSTFQ